MRIERIRIDGREIASDELGALLEKVFALAEARSIETPTYFEATVAAAFLAFARHGVELALGACTIFSPDRVKAVVAQIHRDQFSDRGLVFNDQDAGLLHKRRITGSPTRCRPLARGAHPRP